MIVSKGIVLGVSVVFVLFLTNKIKIPPIMQELNMIEPRALPTEISAFPPALEKIDTKSSGSVVPMLTMLAPIIAGDIFSLFAKIMAESTNLFPPYITKIKEVINNKMFNNISI